MRCPKCGVELAPNSLQCKRCLSAKTSAVSEETPEKKELKSRTRVSGFQKISKTIEDEFPVVSYVICPPFQPRRLNKEQGLGIGRDEANQLVLPSREVSRMHAVIQWEEDCYVLKDLDSANGTFINEDYIDRHELKDGDKVLVGTHTIIYREVPKGTIPYMDIPNFSLKETLKIHMKKDIPERLRKQVGKSSFSGDINSIGLFSILQMLGTDRKSGCLKIGHKNITSRVYFLEGEVVHSIHDELQGRDAFFEAIKKDEGKFDFSSEEAPEEVTMSDRVEWLLLEGARQIDEEMEM